VITTMTGEKTTTQVEALVPERKGVGRLRAYEIHMGLTQPVGAGQPAFKIIRRNGKTLRVPDGWVSSDGRVWGTYLHGLFDNDQFRRALRDELRENHSAPETIREELCYQNFQEAQLNRLADLLRRHLDMAYIKNLIQPVK
jgi:adenosylcobyric acid synthase